ncbi:MAG: PKD domain-containing protein [Bacteroidales bacterium]
MKKAALISLACLLLLSKAKAQNNLSIPGACGGCQNNSSLSRNVGHSPGNGNHSLGQTYNNTACGLNYVQSSAKITTRYSNISNPPVGPGSGYPCILPPISGIPSCYVIDKAYIYWTVSYEAGSSTTPTLILTNPLGVTNNYSGTLIGVDVPKCWQAFNCGGCNEIGTRAFRANVTPAITGNGTYSIDSIAGNTIWEVDGATLIIIYKDISAAWKGSLIIDDGIYTEDTLLLAFNDTITGFTACGTGSNSTAFLIASDIQDNRNFPNYTFDATLNGTPGTFPRLFWNFAQVSTIVNSGQTSASYNTSGYYTSGGDCYAVCAVGLYFQTTTCGSCSPLTLNTSSTVANCSVCNGTATVVATGGTAPYTYTWSTTPIQTTATASNLCAGTYTVTVADASGCNTSTASVTVTSNASATVSVFPTTSIICSGNSVTLTASGVVSYSWSPATGLSATTGATVTASHDTTTTYIVTGTDATGCTSTASVLITVNPGPTVSISASANPICPGTSTTLTASGATTYSWSGGLGTSNPVIVTPASTTTYTVTGTTAGCTGTASITVNLNSNLTISISASANPICTGASTTLTASGATTYSWSGGLGTSNPVIVTPASTTTYTVIGTTAGCTGTASITITVSPNPTVSISASANPICTGTSTTLTANGATSYSWSGGLGTSNPVIVTLASTTTYTVTGTTAGCTGTASITITINPVPTVTISSTNETCGQPNGTATVTATGGSGIYTYLWNTTPAQTDSTATNLAAGNYAVTVSDGSCTTSASVTVNSLSTISLTTNTTDATCNQSNGTATVTATGGSGTYTYSWNTIPAQANSTATNLSAGNYIVSVNDGSCTMTVNVTINNIPGVTASISNSVNETCSNSNGSATVHAIGGTLPYTYLWSSSPAQTTSVLQNVHAGAYYVTVTDANNCKAIDTVVITNSPAPVATIGSFTNATCGLSNGSATVNVTGGASPYSFNWNTSPPQYTQVASNIPGGNYIVTVTDANSCTATASVGIAASPGPAVTISGTTNASCGQSNGTIDITVTGGTPPYMFNWNSSPPQNGQNLLNVPAGNYIVFVIDANGCTTSVSITVGQNAGPSASASSVNDTCNQSKGTAIVIASGGSGTYSYLWSNGQTTSTITHLTAGTYTVTISDGSCSASASVIVSNTPGPVAGFTENPRILTLMDGPVTFTDNSSGNIVNWQWNFGDGDFGNGNYIQHQYSDTGTYLVTHIVTDNNGCTDTVTDTIKVKDYFTFYIPNAFTPNNNDFDDTWYPQGMNVDPKNYDEYIYDRWGNLVFHTTIWNITTHRAEGWNGTINNKGNFNDVVMDIYVYKINLKEFNNGLKHEYVGRITLVP